MLRNRFTRRWTPVFAWSTAFSAILIFAQADRSFGSQFSTWESADYAVLMSGDSSLTINGGTPNNRIIGNIGFGSSTAGLGTFTATGATGILAGHQPGNIAESISAVNFADSSGNYTPGSTLTITSPSSSEPGTSITNVTDALNQLANIASAENIAVASNYDINIVAGNSINLANFPANDGNGNIVFDATIDSSMSSAPGGIFDILGSTNQTVIFNISAPNPTLEGVINLEGPTNQGSAILAPNVIFNFTNPNSTLTMDTGQNVNKLETEGIYYAPTDNLNVSNTEIFGLLVGGGTSTLTSTTIHFEPEPSSFVLAAIGITLLAGCRRLVGQRKGKLA